MKPGTHYALCLIIGGISLALSPLIFDVTPKLCIMLIMSITLLSLLSITYTVFKYSKNIFSIYLNTAIRYIVYTIIVILLMQINVLLIPCTIISLYMLYCSQCVVEYYLDSDYKFEKN